MLKKDLSNKVILITGANDGIGKATAISLAQLNPKKIIMACRESDKSKAAHQEVCENYAGENKKNVILEFIDLSDLASVKGFVNRIVSKNIKVDVLVNNAGVMPKERQQTKDGFEMQFGTNHLGHFLLTELLLSNNALNTESETKPRIIIVASHVMFAGHIDFDDLHFEKRKYGSWKAYIQSKLANATYANYLNRKYGDRLVANSLHPGTVRTEVAVKGSGLFHFLTTIIYPVFYLLSLSPAQGAETTIYLASSPEVEGKGGLYWANCKPFTMLSSKESQNERNSGTTLYIQ